MGNFCWVVVSTEGSKRNRRYCVYAESFHDKSFGMKKAFLHSGIEVRSKSALIKEIRYVIRENKNMYCKLESDRKKPLTGELETELKALATKHNNSLTNAFWKNKKG